MRWLAVLGAMCGCDSFAIDQVAIHACITASACLGWEVAPCTESATQVLADPDYFRRFLVGTRPPIGSREPIIDTPARTYRSLAAARNDCAAAEACYGPLASCDLDAPAGTCNGTIAVNCWIRSNGGMLGYLDCGEAGLGCATSNESVPRAYCGTPWTGGGDWCDGDKYFRGVNGVTVERDCSILNQICTFAPQGVGHMCSGGGALCSSPSTSCDGPRITICDSTASATTGNYYSYDCGQVYPLTTCHSSGDFAQCQGAWDSCSDMRVKCQGTRIQYCILGQNIDVDCRDLGFTTCAVSLAGNVACQ